MKYEFAITDKGLAIGIAFDWEVGKFIYLSFLFWNLRIGLES